MLTKIEFQPGIWTDETDLTAENTFSSGDKVRFRRGRPQTIGGWEAATADTFTDPARGSHAWAMLDGDKVVGFGTASVLYSLFGGAIDDITPLKAKGTLVDPFSTTNGSATVIVTDTDHGLINDGSVTFSNADAVGGITIDGTYTITTVLTKDEYTITHTSSATSTATGGGKVDFEATLEAGLVDAVPGSGWGSGDYSEGTWGGATGEATLPRVWSIDNWGTNMLAVPTGGALYEWQPHTSYDEKVTNGDFGSTDDWTTGTGWSIGAGVATATAGSASDLTQDVRGDLIAGALYVLSVDVTRTAGTLQFQVESADSVTGTVNMGEAFEKTAAFTRYFYAPAKPINIHFSKDSAFAGTVDNVSIKVLDIAYRIMDAPQHATGMFVDPNRIVVLYGTHEFDGDYNALLVRWSDQENNRDWTPAATNLSGEYVLASGTRCVGGMATRGQNLIWTDTALYTMRFTGSVADVYRFDLAGKGCGLLGKTAAAEYQGAVYWWGRDGQFYVYQGGEPQAIPCPVRRDAWDNLDHDQAEKTVAATNSEFGEVWWFYPDTRDGNECSRFVALSVAEGAWFTGILERTSWVPTGVYEKPLAFGTDNRVYFQESGTTANGATIDWHLETGWTDLEDGQFLLRASRYVPDFDDQSGNITVTFTFRQWPRASSTVSVGTYTITPTTAEIPLRHLGRQMRIKWEDGTNSKFARWGAQRLDMDRTGARR